MVALQQWSVAPRPCLLFAVVVLLLILNISLFFPSASDAARTRLPSIHHYFKTTSTSSSSASSLTKQPSLSKVSQPDPIDYSRFAYVQYATNLPYLCNSVMLFARLNELRCRADRLLMYPEHWSLANDTAEGPLLLQAQELYGVRLQPIQIQHRDWSDPTWTESYTKLLAVNQTQYERVLSLDSDSTVLKCMDELFTVPEAPFAMPRAYWLWNEGPQLSDQLLLAQPSGAELERILRAVDAADEHTFDMDIMNNLYLPSAVVLPHRKYDLLTGEFRTESGAKDHAAYLGNEYETWNPWTALREASFLHFSDWPVPKPWLPIPQAILDSRGPKCMTESNCQDREVWLTVYGDFKRRRKAVCGIPDWGGVIGEASLEL